MERLDRVDSARRLAIATALWNSAEELPAYCAAANALRARFAISLTLVDNASSDGSAEIARRLAPWARVIANADNRGFAAACNQALQGDDSPLALFLNPDARIAPDALAALAAALDSDRRAAAAGPALVDARGRVWPSAPRRELGPRGYWAQYSLLAPLWRRIWGAAAGRARSLAPAAKPRPAAWLMGACLLARREAFDAAGGFPEAYHLYCEDAELGKRLRASGATLLYVPAAEAFHAHGASSAKAPGESAVALFRALRLYADRNLAPREAEALARRVRLDMRLRMALSGIAHRARPRDGGARTRRAVCRRILAIWGDAPGRP